MRTKTGAALLEVIIALVVLGIGASALTGATTGLARAVRLGQTAARVGGRSASRLEALRALYLDGRPSCRVPPAGQVNHPDGLIERWWATGDAAQTDVAVAMAWPRGRVDSISLSIRCR
ncbi:MAG: hypothetical protein ABI647_12800 [Gemmatimonadota bacterium]